MKLAGTSPAISNPKKSFICVEKIVKAIPEVNPTIIGYGINFIMSPNFKTPIKISKTPAIQVAIANPLVPYSEIMPAMITINAPVGPPI